MEKRHLALTVLLGTATFVAVATTLPEEVESQSAPLEPRQLRVVWTEDPADHALISWTTTEAGDEHVAYFDTTPRDGAVAEYAASVAASENGAYDDAGPYYHHARLTDLQPDTEYHFVVETDGNASRELWFRTAPEEDVSFKLLYGGDSRSGREDRQRMNRLIARTHGDDPEILALVHGGDYINWANTWWQWSNWLDDHEITFGEDGRVLPIVPAKGNHEGRGTTYNRVFGNPGGSAETNWFYTRFGGLALINLDTEDSFAGDQRQWLEEQLQEGREAKWLVVNYHRPAFPAVKTPSGAREHWVPLFEEYGVDLV
jgi:phosphodiesterase/alkaline phosphatase D-like protein